MTSRMCYLGSLLTFAAWTVLGGTLPPSRDHGRVLVLNNHQVMEGEIEKVGTEYRVRRGTGETWVPGDGVLCLCQDLCEAHRTLRRIANLEDPDERVRLARWCHLHGLRAEALEEARAAQALRPEHPECLRLLRALQSGASTAGRRVDPPAHAAARPEAGGLSAVDVTAESLALFTTRVQPILMNACATCHASGRGGNFRLTRTFDDPTIARRATQENLAAAAAQLNGERPEASPLLTRAVALHGDAAQPPLKGRQTAAYRTLQEWVRVTTPGMTPVPPSATAAWPPPPTKPLASASVRQKPDRTSRDAMPPRPTASPTPTDPFDPAIFNRAMHPERGDAGRDRADAEAGPHRGPG